MSQRPWWQPREDDAFSDYREKVIYVLALVFVLVFLPFSLNNFIQGRYILGSFTTAIIAILAVDAIAIYFGRRPPLPVPLIILPSLPAVVMAVQQQGFYAILWCYPALLLFFFVLTRWMANLMTVALLIALTWVSLDAVGTLVTLRLIVTMTLTAVFSNLLVSLIGGLQHKLLEQARSDHLTGAFNRRQMDLALGDMINETRGKSRSNASLALLDVDFFKAINDQFGHAAGDAVLKGVVDVAKREKREADAVFRIGGEEFVVLLPGMAEGAAVAFAERLRVAIANADLLAGAAPVTVSVGVAGLRPDDTVDSWLRAADGALYRAKDGGRDRVLSGR